MLDKMSGMVIFPVRYIVHNDHTQSYVIARNLGGKFVKVHILPHERHVQKASQSSSSDIPLISEFAKKSKHSNKKSIADDKNSAKNPHGIILCEQVTQVADSGHEGYLFPTYHAKWASTLRESRFDPLPGLGVGFMEIAYTYPKKNPNQSFASIRSMISGYLEKAKSPVINPLDREEILVREAEKIYNARAKRYSAIIIKHKEIIEDVSVNTPNELRSLLEGAVSKYTTESGRYGVALIRVRKGNVVDLNASTRFTMDRNYAEERPSTPDENWARFRKYESDKLIPFIRDAGYSIDIIPCQRIYFGPIGVSKYDSQIMPISGAGQVRPTSKLMKQFVDKSYHNDPSVNLVDQHAFLASFIGVRVSRIEDGDSAGNEVASTIHSYSKAIAPAIAIRADLSYYEVNRETPKHHG